MNIKGIIWDDLLDTQYQTITLYMCLSVFAQLDVKRCVGSDCGFKCRSQELEPPLNTKYIV